MKKQKKQNKLEVGQAITGLAGPGPVLVSEIRKELGQNGLSGKGVRDTRLGHPIIGLCYTYGDPDGKRNLPQDEK